jgi:hypothetical protein
MSAESPQRKRVGNHPGRHRVAAVLTSVGVVAAAVSLGLLFITVRSGAESDSPRVIRGSGYPGQTGPVAIPNLEPRLFPAQVWTGDRLFVFGGYSPGSRNWNLLNDGALVEPGTANTELLPAPPFDPPLWEPQAITTEGKVFVIGHSCKVDLGVHDDSQPKCSPNTYAAATFDLSSREWSTAEIPDKLLGLTGFDAIVRGLGATSDGRAVIGLGTWRDVQYWTYQPATETWSQLPNPGIHSDAACTSDDRLFVLSAKYQQNGRVLEEDPARSAEPGKPIYGYEGDGYVDPSLTILDLNKAESWRTSPASKGTKFRTAPPRLACMGPVAVAVSQLSPGEALAVYSNETDTWSLAAPPPIRRVFTGEVSTGKELVFLPLENEVGEPGEAYNPFTDSWRSLTGFPAVTRGALWSGSALVGYSEPIATTPPIPKTGVPPEQLPRATPNQPGIFRYEPR